MNRIRLDSEPYHLIIRSVFNNWSCKLTELQISDIKKFKTMLYTSLLLDHSLFFWQIMFCLDAADRRQTLTVEAFSERAQIVVKIAFVRGLSPPRITIDWLLSFCSER